MKCEVNGGTPAPVPLRSKKGNKEILKFHFKCQLLPILRQGGETNFGRYKNTVNQDEICRFVSEALLCVRQTKKECTVAQEASFHP